MEITLNHYNKLLTEIKESIHSAQENINQTIKHEKVLMSWRIGKIIETHLIENNRAEYGAKLINQLEQDIFIAASTLYQMRSFYKHYPDLKAENIHLNWSHYRALITISNPKKRDHFEQLALENNLNAQALQSHIVLYKKTIQNLEEQKPNKKLYCRKGQMFHYQLVNLDDSGKIFIDCGFKIFTEIKTHLKAPLIVESKKEDGLMTLRESPIPKSQIYTYKAYLNKVVDGDTLRVTLDLGFGVRHKEILRLKGIDAAEMKTVAGQKSAAALREILDGVEFLIVKTNKVDIYGRYLSDVLFLKDELDENKVAKNGIYLNQFLLDKGLAKSFQF